MNAPWKETTMRIAYFGAVVGASLAVGCGGDDDGGSNNADRYEGDERDVAALVDDFAEAGRDGDGGRVCDEIFAVALTRNVEREAGQSCETEVEENLPEGDYELEVDAVDVKGTTATANVTDQDDNRSVLHIVKSGAEWRILRVTAAP
jgi:hypothetical protein